MTKAEIKRTLWLVLGLGLAWCWAPAASGQEVCCPRLDFYGDGHHGSVTISTNTQLYGDMYYQNLTIQPGVTLDTRGYIVRVCGTLLNYGSITDSLTGGLAGPSGEKGYGHDPYETGVPCPSHTPTCTSGQPGDPGASPSIPQPGNNGHGGHGGGGGGGGGGAWCTIDQADADGGNGGDGGMGGRGGGYVQIYAYRFDNRGVIYADGQPGANGQAAATDNCGPEYFKWWNIIWKDLGGGGGGGGGGGDGGNGGTVEVRCGVLVNAGTLRANGGAGTSGGAGAPDSGPLPYGVTVGYSANGCPSGSGGGQSPCTGNGGGGGKGEYRRNYSPGDGGNGTCGAAGAPGTTSITFVQPYCKIAGQCYADGVASPVKPCQYCNATVDMNAWTNRPPGYAVDDGLFCNGTDTCLASGVCCDHSGDPCLPCGCNEVTDQCQYTYTVGGQVYSDCTNPPGSGRPNVVVSISCSDGFIGQGLTNSQGFWEIPGVPCYTAGENICTVTPTDAGRQCCYIQTECPPVSCQESVQIAISEANEAANQSIKFWSRCRPYDMNGDGDVTILGDMPCFQDCVYDQHCACCASCCVGSGDCNCDGHLTLIGDVPCYIDCLYYNYCPWCPTAREGGAGEDQSRAVFTIGGAVYTDLANPIFSGLAGVAVTVQQVGGPYTNTATTTVPYGIWQMANVPEGTYTVMAALPGWCFLNIVGGVAGAPPPITIVVNQANYDQNQSIQFLGTYAPITLLAAKSCKTCGCPPYQEFCVDLPLVSSGTTSPGVETRAGGITKLTFQFNGAPCLLGTASAVATLKRSDGAIYTPVNAAVAGSVLTLTFSGIPNAWRYAVCLNVPNLTGDSDVEVIGQVGNVAQAPPPTKWCTDGSDLSAIGPFLGQATTQANCKYDIVQIPPPSCCKIDGADKSTIAGSYTCLSQTTPVTCP